MIYDYIKSFPKCHAGDAITVSYNVPCDIALITERDYQLTVNRDDDSFLLRVSADEMDECHASLVVPFDGDWRMVVFLYDEMDECRFEITCKYQPVDILQYNATHTDSKIVCKQVGAPAPCSLLEWKRQTGNTFCGNMSCCCSCFRMVPLTEFECVKVSVASKGGAKAYYATPICHHCATTPDTIRFLVPTSTLSPCK
jgi:hypothetical protein